MKYLIFLLFTATFFACVSNEPEEMASRSDKIEIRYDSTNRAGQALAGLLKGYLDIKRSFPGLQDTQQVHRLAIQMMGWADSLSRLSDSFPAPLRDSVQMLSIGISDEIKGFMAETDPKGIALSFQLTGMQLYDLLRIVRYNGIRVYLFQSIAGGEEANWLDVVRNASHPFLLHPMGQETAIDSLVFK